MLELTVNELAKLRSLGIKTEGYRNGQRLIFEGPGLILYYHEGKKEVELIQLTSQHPSKCYLKATYFSFWPELFEKAERLCCQPSLLLSGIDSNRLAILPECLHDFPHFPKEYLLIDLVLEAYLSKKPNKA